MWRLLVATALVLLGGVAMVIFAGQPLVRTVAMVAAVASTGLIRQWQLARGATKTGLPWRVGFVVLLALWAVGLDVALYRSSPDPETGFSRAFPFGVVIVGGAVAGVVILASKMLRRA